MLNYCDTCLNLKTTNSHRPEMVKLKSTRFVTNRHHNTTHVS